MRRFTLAPDHPLRGGYPKTYPEVINAMMNGLIQHRGSPAVVIIVDSDVSEETRKRVLSNLAQAGKRGEFSDPDPPLHTYRRLTVWHTAK